jgi:Fe-S-cluster containining protein
MLPRHRAERMMNTVLRVEIGSPLPGNKCGYCTNSKCCTYITERIETPRSMHDFDHLLWQVSHKGVHLYKDTDGWFLLINNSCSHLQPGGRCGIYEDRPGICRQYSNEYCEYDAPAEEGFDLYFTDYESLLRYCRKRFRTWDRFAATRGR